MKKIKKFVFMRMDEGINEQFITPDKSSIWITDQNLENWFFEYKSDGILIYNGLLFTQLLKIFSLRPSEISNFLKLWFESRLNLPVRSINRKNSDLDYILGGLKKKRNDLSLDNRYGFSYNLVKRYKNIQNKSSDETVSLSEFISVEKNYVL